MQYSSESESDTDSEAQDNSSGIDLEAISAVKRIEPNLSHRIKASGSVLALAADDDFLFAGLQGGEIAAFKLDTYELMNSVPAHENSVLSLHLSEDGRLLFSGGADSTVVIWLADRLQRLSTVVSHYDVGDIFCLAFSTKQNMLLCGTQSQAFQWHKVDDNQSAVSANGDIERRRHRFFDSRGPGDTPWLSNITPAVMETPAQGSKKFAFRKRNILTSTHDSYVTSMLLLTESSMGNVDGEVLVSGGADGSVKFWDVARLDDQSPRLVHTFKNSGFGIKCLAYSEPLLYAGLTRGQVRIYSLENRKLVQKIFTGPEDVNTIQVLNGQVFCGTSDGRITQFNSQFTETGAWKSSNGKILASTLGTLPGQKLFIVGSNDNTISFWNAIQRTHDPRRPSIHGNDEMIRSLRDLIAFKTVSAQARFAGQCNEAASYLRKLCNILQAETAFLPSSQQINPIVLAKFRANHNEPKKHHILFYGHYDVVDAEVNSSSQQKWRTDPFRLMPADGYLYGRGVSDNKGPILAALYAVAELLQKEKLSCDVTFLLDGEEEAGSQGFEQAVQQNKSMIGEIDHILLANSYWHDDRVPCLTYGMRGVIHATVRVESDMPDRHSGMDGKAATHEPLKDLTALLGSLVGPHATQVMIPEFYKGIAEPSFEEQRRYKTITKVLAPLHPEISPEAYEKSLQQKWSMPNLTYHQIETPEPKSAVTIARSAEAPISIRVVPGQSAAKIADNLVSFLKGSFASLGSSNRLEVQINAFSDAWLGDPHNDIFSTLSAAITKVWGLILATKQDIRSGSAGIATHLPKDGPLFIREGGSIPAIGFLEKEFEAPAAMFPCGQSSDNAHLANERMRVENLYAAREVFREVFSELPTEAAEAKATKQKH